MTKEELVSALLERAKANKNKTYQPEILFLDKVEHQKRLASLITNNSELRFVDYFDEQIRELSVIEKPSILEGQQYLSIFSDSVLVYYPWLNSIVRILTKENFEKVRTSRNKNLIRDSEQNIFKECKIGITGLNVGSYGAFCIALEGGCRAMKLADYDILSLSNMNRFLGSLNDLGLSKSIISARRIYEINPFIEIDLYQVGINKDNVEAFLLSPRIDILIEETDSLLLKIQIRELTKTHKIPVVMVTGNGSNIVIDVERYDLDEDLQIMNGNLRTDVIHKIKSSTELPFHDKIQLCRDFMGSEILTDRLNESFDLVGSQLAGIPQIAESSFVRGAALAWFTRNIMTGQNYVPSGRYFIELEKVIVK